jgi:hypothetical protein
MFDGLLPFTKDKTTEQLRSVVCTSTDVSDLICLPDFWTVEGLVSNADYNARSPLALGEEKAGNWMAWGNNTSYQKLSRRRRPLACTVKIWVLIRWDEMSARVIVGMRWCARRLDQKSQLLFDI